MQLESAVIVPPYNRRRLEELLADALTQAGFLPPMCTPNSMGDENTVLDLEIFDGVYTTEQIAQIQAILEAVAVDPRRNGLPSAQVREQLKTEAHGRLKAKYAQMKANGNLTLPEVKAVVLDMLLRMDEDID